MMPRLRVAAHTLRARRPLIIAVLMFGVWCGIAPTVWWVIAAVAARSDGPQSLFYILTAGLLIVRIIRAASWREEVFYTASSGGSGK